MTTGHSDLQAQERETLRRGQSAMNPMLNPSPEEIADIARQLRIDIVRMLWAAGSGHPGGSLSVADILAVLYFHEVRRTRENSLDPARDRVVLSKGHGVPAMYACLARLGIVARDDLPTLRTLGSALQGHPDVGRIPQVEASTGSLGQGMSIAQGMAIAGKMVRPGFRVYAVTGDGETQEGQIWECAMSAPMFKLDNLVVILDANGAQIDGHTRDVMNIEPMVDKMLAFNWHVIEVDGHDIPALIAALDQARATKGKPTYVIARTVKGRGVSFMENDPGWHGVAPDSEQTRRALGELGACEEIIASIA